MTQAPLAVVPQPGWILVLPNAGDMIVVVTDGGETPIFDDADLARRVGLDRGLERCQALRVPANAELVLPTPYQQAMTFEAAQAESRALLTARGRRRLRGE
jgi:hypothetical protein